MNETRNLDDQDPENGQDPSQDRRWQMAALRKRRGYSQERLAEEVGVTPNSIRRWERGTSEPSAEHRRPLARALEVSLDRLEKILRNEDDEDEDAPEKVRPLVPEGLSVYLSMEHSASRLQAYQPHFIHGLLQTREYARALVQASDYADQSSQQVERLVGFRMNRRQEVLTRDEDPLELDLVLTETALHQWSGSKVAMRDQLQHLADMAERPNVTVRILAFTSGPHTAGYGPFAILSFPWEEISVVYVNSYVSGAAYIESKSGIKQMASLFERIRAQSLAPQDSVTLIRRVAAEAYS